MGEPRKRSGPEGPPRVAAAKQANTEIVPDPWGIRSRAQARLREQDRRRAICREAERLMPLVRYYGPRPLRSIPLGQFLVEGWWAA
jgi:hypothetical protein